MATHKKTDALVLVKKQAGVTLIPASTPLTRLNYFDGKFLRAADLQTEQRYLRRLVHLSNQAAGVGVVHGFDVSLGGSDTLNIGPGMALDPKGRVLLLTQSVVLNVQELIDRSEEAAKQSAAAALAKKGTGFDDCVEAGEEPPSALPRGGDIYFITIAHAEAFCGEEAVYGKLCEEACLTSTDRPFLIEGLVIRAVPRQLETLYPTSSAVPFGKKHLRSQFASAYFQYERGRLGSLISKAGLASDVWCFGAELEDGNEVPVGVVARSGTNTVFLDAWAVRREVIDTPARRYWQWRMAMRPWDVFLAHVLQFQCQLHDLFKDVADPGGGDDPCGDARKLITEATDTVGELLKFYETVSGQLAKLPAAAKEFAANEVTISGGLARAGDLHKKFVEAKSAFELVPLDRLLINGGIVELPSAGYLPVTPSATLTVNQQVRRLMGEGVELRFCIVRPDYVAHALEEAQHMDRISLTEGLDNPEKKPQVDILVPNGEAVETKAAATGNGYEASVEFLPEFLGLLVNNMAPAFLQRLMPRSLRRGAIFTGAGRSEVLPGGGRAFHAALLFTSSPIRKTEGIFDSVVGRQPTDGAEIPADLKEAANEGDTEISGGRLFSRLMDAAIRVSRTKTAAAGGAGVEAEKTTRVEATEDSAEIKAERDQFNLVTGEEEQQQPAVPVGLWLTVTSDRELSTLQPGQSVKIIARAVIGGTIPSINLPDRGEVVNSPFYLDSHLTATVTVNQITPVSEGTSSRRCFVSLFGGIVVKFLDVKLSDASNANYEVTLIERNRDDLTSLSIEVENPEGEGGARLSIRWGGEPYAFKALVGFLHEKAAEPIFRTEFVKNPAVFVASNTNHTQALSGLQAVGDALKDPAFVQASTGLLFPPAPQPTGELVVRGTADWVLFHRRRAKKCSVEVQPPPPAPPRRYQVYHVVQDADTIKRLVLALRSNDAVTLSRFEFTKVDIVEFGAGVTTLNTNPSSIKSDWQSVDPGNRLVYGAIASAGDAAGEGNVIASGRLTQMEGAVASVSPTDDTSIADVLPAVPTPLAVPNTDGVIVLITMKEVTTVCHSVYMLQSPNQFSDVKALLGIPSLTFDQFITRLKAESVGDVLFEAGTANVALGNPSSLDVVVQAWQAKNFGQIFGRFVVSHTDDTAAEKAMHEQQAEKIMEALSPQARAVRDSGTTALQFPGGCVALTFMARG